MIKKRARERERERERGKKDRKAGMREREKRGSHKKLHLNVCSSNLCEYFVSIHGQHKICGIRDASSSGCCRSSLIW